jgi:hypothetical protein
VETDEIEKVNMCKITQRLDGSSIFRCLGFERCKFRLLQTVGGDSYFLKDAPAEGCPYLLKSVPAGCQCVPAQNEAMFRQKHRELLRALGIIEGGKQ